MINGLTNQWTNRSYYFLNDSGFIASVQKWKFCFKIDKTVLENSSVEENFKVMSVYLVVEFASHFKDEREDLNDDEHIGQLKLVTKENDVKNVRRFIPLKFWIKLIGKEINMAETYFLHWIDFWKKISPYWADVYADKRKALITWKACKTITTVI